MDNNTPPVKLETVDLIAELSKATEHKAEFTTPPAEHTEITAGDPAHTENTTTATNSDFADEPEILTDPIDDHAEKLKAIEIKKGKLRGKKLAPVIVDAFDAIQQAAFPFAFERTLSDEDRLAMKNIARKYRASKEKELRLDEGDQRIMDIFIVYDEYVDSLPMTQDDKESFIEPLAELLGDITLTQSPGGTLLLAVLMFLVTRSAPIGMNYLTNKE